MTLENHKDQIREELIILYHLIVENCHKRCNTSGNDCGDCFLSDEYDCIPSLIESIAHNNHWSLE